MTKFFAVSRRPSTSNASGPTKRPLPRMTSTPRPRKRSGLSLRLDAADHAGDALHHVARARRAASRAAIAQRSAFRIWCAMRADLISVFDGTHPVPQAVAAELVLLDQRDLGAERRAAGGDDQPARAAADHRRCRIPVASSVSSAAPLDKLRYSALVGTALPRLHASAARSAIGTRYHTGAAPFGCRILALLDTILTPDALAPPFACLSAASPLVLAAATALGVPVALLVRPPAVQRAARAVRVRGAPVGSAAPIGVSIDQPADEALFSRTLDVSGWALDRKGLRDVVARSRGG